MPAVSFALAAAVAAFFVGGACLWRALFNPARRALALTGSAILLIITTGLWLFAFLEVR